MLNLLTHLKHKKPNAEQELSEAAELLWTHLDATEFHYEISKKLTALIKTVSSENYQVENSSGNAYVRHLAFLQYLEKDDNLHKIIVSPPSLIKKIIKEITSIISPDDFFISKKSSAESTPFGNLLKKELFNYKKYRSSASFEAVYNKLDIIPCTCAYCNSGTMISIERSVEGKKSREHFLFDIDHFYPSVRYPYLALSFFNHIPTCEACNEKLKLDKDVTIETHLHPFLDCFDQNYTFIPIFGGNQVIEVKSLIIKKETNITDGMIDILELESRGKEFIHFASVNELADFLHKNQHRLRNGHPDLVRTIDALKISFSGDRSHILSKPYQKIKRDIAKYFDIQKVYVK